MTSQNTAEFHRFAHEAMATTFEILVDADDSGYAGQAAGEAFRELDRLEAKLSRFDESSDVSQINRAKAGTPVIVSYDTFACLKLALWVSQETNGVFDITVPNGGFNHINLNEKTLTVILCHPGLSIDLGGIGKGYALDCMAGILDQWEVKRSLLLAGGSTALALDPPNGEEGWVLQFGDGNNLRQLTLYQNSFSGSGLAVKGEHIVDPRSGNPVKAQKKAWALAPTAALSDALSTAFMILDGPDIDSFCENHDGIGWALELPDKRDVITATSRLPSP